MSRAYRIAVKESVTRTVRVEDGVSAALELLPILATERMGTLLGEELERRGFVRDGDTCRRTESDGVEIEIHLPTARLTARIVGEETVEKTLTRERRIDQNKQASEEKKLRTEVQAQLEEQIEKRRKELSDALAAKLERKLADLKKELDQVTTRTTATALKERASQLGQIEEIREEADGSMTIKVRL